MPTAIITKKRLKELEQAEIMLIKLNTAYRWLSEFDKFLSPMWHFLYKGGEISTIREDMRKAFKIHENTNCR